MFGVSKKIKSRIAASLAELLIILAIVGILSVLYHRTVDNNAILVKYAYKNLINNMIEYASTKTESYTLPINGGTWAATVNTSICGDFFNMINTLGESNCDVSNEFDLPNLTTTSGLRFFGLEQPFYHDYTDQNFFNVALDNNLTAPFHWIIVKADLDGITGKNTEGEDVFALELLKNGRIRPSGPANGIGNSKGNMARDPQLYSVSASIKTTADADPVLIGNRLSYAEAQCLSGNPFPYRATNGEIQTCLPVSNNSYKEAIRNLQSGSGATDRDKVRQYWLSLARSGTVCENLYNTQNSVTALRPGEDKWLTPVNGNGKDNCKRCWKAAYKAKFCEGTNAQGADETDEQFRARCPAAIIDETATCTTPYWAEYSTK